MLAAKQHFKSSMVNKEKVKARNNLAIQDTNFENLTVCYVENLEETLRRLKCKSECKVCRINTASVVFLPCGHLGACTLCGESVKECPLCRNLVKKTLKTFLG